ncbi:hypothetical protein Y032_0060g3179 [Ancylostoma ceylanicum]|uniref:Uncharacterized protein n=1 Tax=Ancylostoma ceylanicum TaxID=53326 RepID=A0A016U4N7_9BILA|nr:hypothetical protein Y032_0060g3179 [Ancylostoma ceylanicum]
MHHLSISRKFDIFKYEKRSVDGVDCLICCKAYTALLSLFYFYLLHFQVIDWTEDVPKCNLGDWTSTYMDYVLNGRNPYISPRSSLPCMTHDDNGIDSARNGTTLLDVAEIREMLPT